jgi:hypothetical protein
MLSFSNSGAFAWPWSSKELSLEEQQSLCKEFIGKAYTIDKTALPAINAAAKQIADPTSRQVLYNALSKANDASFVAWREFIQLKRNVPDGLKGTIQEKLEEGATNLELAYYSKRGFYKNMMEFVEKRSMQSQQKAIREGEDAQKYMLIGAAFFEEVKAELKISD